MGPGVALLTLVLRTNRAWSNYSSTVPVMQWTGAGGAWGRPRRGVGRGRRVGGAAGPAAPLLRGCHRWPRRAPPPPAPAIVGAPPPPHSLTPNAQHTPLPTTATALAQLPVPRPLPPRSEAAPAPPDHAARAPSRLPAMTMAMSMAAPVCAPFRAASRPCTLAQSRRAVLVCSRRRATVARAEIKQDVDQKMVTPDVDRSDVSQVEAGNLSNENAEKRADIGKSRSPDLFGEALPRLCRDAGRSS